MNKLLIPFIFSVYMCSTIHAADLHQEIAAFGPVPSRTTGLYPAEERPSYEMLEQENTYSALISYSPKTRYRNLWRIEREDESLDAQISFSQIHAIGNETGWLGFNTRQASYLRIGTDNTSSESGDLLIGAGMTMFGSLGGGPTHLIADVSYSDERAFAIDVDISFLLFHYGIFRDDDSDGHRYGLNFRWAGASVAAVPDKDPWSFALLIDHMRQEDDFGTHHANILELDLAWRLTNNWYLTAQYIDIDELIDPNDGSPDREYIFSLGFGYTN